MGTAGGERVVAQQEIVPLLNVKLIFDRYGVVAHCLVLDKDDEVLGQLPVMSARCDASAQKLSEWDLKIDGFTVKVEQQNG